MGLPKRNHVNSKLFPYKIICLILFLVIVMTKIMSYTCQDLTGSINNNGISETVFSIHVDDLWPCGGKPNCYYQRNSKNCTKMTQLSIRLSLTGLSGLKPPPLIVNLSKSMKKNRSGLFNDPYNAWDQNKPLKLIICDKRLDMLQWAKTSVIANTSLPPTLNMVFSIVHPDRLCNRALDDSKRVQKIKTAALEFSSIFIVNFNDPPECVLVDDFNQKVFWSDGNRGTIEAYDTKTNQIIVLAKFLDMPRSMVIDPTLGLLFWCNFETIGRGSIERVNLDGGNRVEITKGKYDLSYPETLGIDLTKRMLYWTDHQVIHTSDYNGNNHEIIVKSEFYDQNFPGCFSFAADAVEHNFFWENRQLQHFNRSFVPNHLLSISYHKDGEQALNNMKLPAVFREEQNWSHVKWLTFQVTCPKLIPKSYMCFLLPLPLRAFSYLWDNRSLSKYKLEKENNMSKFLEHDEPEPEIKWYYNWKTESRLYYDPRTKHIQFLIYVVEDMNKTAVYKYKSNHFVSYLEYIKVYKSILIIVDPIEESFYFLNSTNNSTKILDFDGTNGRIYLAPNIFSYTTQVMDYSNNAQSHTISIQKYVLTTVFKFVLQSVM